MDVERTWMSRCLGAGYQFHPSDFQACHNRVFFDRAGQGNMLGNS